MRFKNVSELTGLLDALEKEPQRKSPSEREVYLRDLDETIRGYLACLQKPEGATRDTDPAPGISSDRTVQHKWSGHLADYMQLVALKFKNKQDNREAIRRLFGPLRGLPYQAPAENVLIVPSEAKVEFSDLSYVEQKVRRVSEMTLDESRQSRDEFWYNP